MALVCKAVIEEIAGGNSNRQLYIDLYMALPFVSRTWDIRGLSKSNGGKRLSGTHCNKSRMFVLHCAGIINK